MSLYFFNYETAIPANERKLSAEQLLTIFNRNIVKNAELLDYLSKKNIFGIISKSRNESTHGEPESLLHTLQDYCATEKLDSKSVVKRIGF